MGLLYDKLISDFRFSEGLKACINCGTCTAICPASEFYNYDPRIIAITVQTQDEDKIEALLKSEFIWYCGECMSCKTRCPRGNAPGMLIIALRVLSQELGYFVESEKGRQQLSIKRTIGENIINNGYCVHPRNILPALHPEQGPTWTWGFNNLEQLVDKLGANLDMEGAGALRKISDKDLAEIKSIFKVTGGLEFFDKIENYSKQKADEMNLELTEGIDNEYFEYIYNHNNETHN